MARLLRWRLRLNDFWLWWKHTWWFQFAHSPLCQRFRIDVIRLGPLHLCRSCTLVYGAMLLTILALVWFQPGIGLLLGLCSALLMPLVVLSYPPLYRRLNRGLRDVLRFGTGVLLVLLFRLLWTPWFLFAGLSFLGLYGLFRLYRVKRREVKKTECQGCPELGQNQVCSGYAFQAESIRGYRAAMEEELNRASVLSLVVLSSRDLCGKGSEKFIP